jgi:hypothetical protein
VSDLPGAIPDVWPVIDELGVVVELLRTWDDGRYVRLDRDGMPVDEVGRTHHLMTRATFQETMLPQEWEFIGAHRVSRGLAKVQFRYGGNGDDAALGDGQEFEVLVELNAGAGMVTDEIDTCPPYTHVVELRGEFFLVQRRPAPEKSGEAGPDAPAATEASPEPAPTPPEPAPPQAESVADWVEAAAAEEATVAATGGPAGPIVAADQGAAAATAAARGGGKAVDLLQAIADPDGVADEPAGAAASLLANAARPVSGLASELDEGVWEPGTPAAAPAIVDAPPQAAPSGAATLLSEMPEDEDLESMRASSFAQATAFVSSASTQPVEATDGVLTLEQVRSAGCFAWDEFMNLYLPHVGFVAAVLASTPAAGGGPAEVAFIPRSEADVRPIGWHHLVGCTCPHCQP